MPVHHYARKIGSTTIYFISGLFWICLEQFIGILKMKQEFAGRKPRTATPDAIPTEAQAAPKL